MPLTELGSSPQLLQVAGQLGLGNQEKGIEEKKINQQAIENTQKLPEAGAQAALTRKANQVTIDKQMADGLGDPSLEGTSWDPKLLMTVTKVKGAADYHRQLIEAGLLKEDKKDKTAEKVAGIHAKATTDAATITAEGKKDAAKAKTDKADSSAAWFKKMQDSEKSLISALQKKGGVPSTGLAATIKNAIPMLRSSGDAAKMGALKQLVQEYRVARDNYNKKAKAEGLAPQAADPQADDALGTLTGQLTQQDNLHQQPNASVTKLPGME